MAAMLGAVAGATSFMFSLLVTPPITEYIEFRVVTPEVKRSGTLVVAATYEKLWECGGNGIASITNQGSGEERRIFEIPLGNRKPGRWSLDRRYPIPENAEIGLTAVQETLVYDCGVFRAIVRSPAVMFTVKE